MPRREASAGRGSDLVSRLEQGVRDVEGALRRGARELPQLTGLSQTCLFSSPMENVLVQQSEIWCESGRVFMYGDNLVFTVGEGAEGKLLTLSADRRVEPEAVAALSNIYVCASRPADQDAGVQFAPPKQLIELGVSHEPSRTALPQINMYARRPVFDRDFNFRGPGWHPDVGYMIHSFDVDPVIVSAVPGAGNVLERLPTHLRRLFQDFCFRSEADSANAVGMLLTGLLIDHFIASGKPIAALDGNQPNVGKTLLARTWSEVLDGHDAEVIGFTPNDEELKKEVVARLRSKRASILLIDNAKLKAGGEISSAFIEANCTAPTIALRILCTSTEHRQPNDLIWCITMNRTKACRDIISRSVPIRLHHEGDPRTRTIQGGDPRRYAAEHRREILAELAGMVVFWNQQGRPLGQERHRLAEWAAIIGGILAANGITAFLSNIDEAAAEFNTELDELSALAEFAVRSNSPAVRLLPVCEQTGSVHARAGLTAGEFATLFRGAHVLAGQRHFVIFGKSS